MDIVYSDEEIVINGKVVTRLDRFVLDFVSAIEDRAEYVVVSGYLAILLGRPRGTEDVDMIFEYLERGEFQSLHDHVKGQGFEFINPEDVDGLYEMLTDGFAIRAAREGSVIPNIEMKFPKDDFDRFSLSNRMKAVFDDRSLFISPIEMQIAYKLWLSSEKDIEDALYLWGIFKEYLNMDRLRNLMREMGVEGEYGIEV